MMYVLANSDGLFSKKWDFRKSSRLILFFESFEEAFEMLRMLKVRYADDLNDAHIEEFIYPYCIPSWYVPLFPEYEDTSWL